MVILAQCVVVVKIKLGMVGVVVVEMTPMAVVVVTMNMGIVVVVVVEMMGVVVRKMKMGFADGGSCSG